MERGNRMSNSSFVIFIAKNRENQCKLGISIPQKIVKKASQRNLYKRQIKNMFSMFLISNEKSCSNEENHVHCNKVLIVKSNYLKSDFENNKKNFEQIMKKEYFKRKINRTKK
jgi:ribonuclease P protein component